VKQRTHAQIIRDNGGPAKVARALAPVFDVKGPRMQERVKAWVKASSIPPEYWPSLVDREWATTDELAAAAEATAFPELAAQRPAEALA
jgi:hypothetical protein